MTTRGHLATNSSLFLKCISATLDLEVVQHLQSLEKVLLGKLLYGNMLRLLGYIKKHG